MFGRKRKRKEFLELADAAVIILGVHIERERDLTRDIVRYVDAEDVISTFIDLILVDQTSLFSSVSSIDQGWIEKVQGCMPDIIESAELLRDAGLAGGLVGVSADGDHSRYRAHLLGNQLASTFGIERDLSSPRGFADSVVIDGAMNSIIEAIDSTGFSDRRTMTISVAMAAVAVWLVTAERNALSEMKWR